MDMSVNPDGMGSRVDYSDFEYQQLNYRHTHTNLTGDNAESVINFETPVLAGIGGLDNNEVAELVYMSANVFIEHQQADADLDVGSETQFIGVIGANLPNSDDLVPFAAGNDPTGDVISTNNADAGIFGNVYSEDRVFASFANVKHPAFDDQTNGTGGAGGAQIFRIEKPFRDLVGRGPVLDSSDDMNVTSQLTQEDEIIDAIGSVSIELIWDVAETSDAGRAFSVPDSM